MNGLVQGKKIAYNLRSQLKALVLPMTKAEAIRYAVSIA